jgi:hypothetical protein
MTSIVAATSSRDTGDGPVQQVRGSGGKLLAAPAQPRSDRGKAEAGKSVLETALSRRVERRRSITAEEWNTKHASKTGSTTNADSLNATDMAPADMDPGDMDPCLPLLESLQSYFSDQSWDDSYTLRIVRFVQSIISANSDSAPVPTIRVSQHGDQEEESASLFPSRGLPSSHEPTSSTTYGTMSS